MYAIIETGGKQVRVEVGSKIYVEKLDAEVGSLIRRQSCESWHPIREWCESHCQSRETRKRQKNPRLQVQSKS